MLKDLCLSLGRSNNINKKAGYVKKFRKKKLQGGRLKEEIKPNRNTNEYNNI